MAEGFKTIPVRDASDTLQDVLYYEDSSGRLVAVTRLEGAILQVPDALEVAEPLTGNGIYYFPAFSRPMRGLGISNDSSGDLTVFAGPPVNPSGSNLPTDSGDWEQGSIVTGDGSENTSDNRIRTSGFYPFTGPRTLEWNADYWLLAAEYDASGNWLRIIGGSWLVSPATIVPGADTAQLRLVCRLPSGAITPDAGDVLDLSAAPGRGVVVKPGEVFEGRFAPFQSLAVETSGAWRAYGLAEPVVAP